MKKTIAATEANFQSVVLDAEGPVLVDFWAAWCSPCRALAPALDDLAEDYAGEATIVKVDAEAEQALAASHAVSGLPTLILFKGGVERQRLMGNQTRTRLSALLDDHL